MAISNKQKTAAAALIGVGSLILVGAGAGAAYTDSVDATWSLKAPKVDPKVDLVVEATNGWAAVAGSNGNQVQMSGDVLDYGTSSLVTVKNTSAVPVVATVSVSESGDLAKWIEPSASFQFGKTTTIQPGGSANISVWIDAPAFPYEASEKTGSVVIKVDGAVA